MNKADFLRRLEAALPGPPQEKGDILYLEFTLKVITGEKD